MAVHPQRALIEMSLSLLYQHDPLSFTLLLSLSLFPLLPSPLICTSYSNTTFYPHPFLFPPSLPITSHLLQPLPPSSFCPSLHPLIHPLHSSSFPSSTAYCRFSLPSTLFLPSLSSHLLSARGSEGKSGGGGCLI